MYMRLTALFVAFSLVGCGVTLGKKDLTYKISIEEAADERVFHLRGVVEKTVPKVGEKNVSGAGVPAAGGTKEGTHWSVQTLQGRFEESLWEEEKRLLAPLENITDSQLQRVSSKGLTRFALEPASPDQTLDRFDELLRSTKWVRDLPPVEADESPEGTFPMMGEDRYDSGSQWCGNRSLGTCKDKLHPLYYIEANPPDLYENLGKLSHAIRATEDRNRTILALGYEIPWDKRGTLIRYGVTLYFEEEIEGGTPVTTFLGYDVGYANEATPKPHMGDSRHTVAQGSFNEGEKRSRSKITIQDVVTWPIAVTIGVKNAVFEVAKVPFSFIGGIAAGRDAVWKYPLQNLYTAYEAVKVEMTTGTGEGAYWLRGPHRLLTEIPIVGPIFLFAPDTRKDHSEQSLLGATDGKASQAKLFLSRGIYGGNKWGQDTGLWAAFAKEAYPSHEIYSPPYRHGTATDVIWSLLNFSHGPAYDETAYIMARANRNDRIYLAGHSGGVQRSVVASRLLWYHGYEVTKIVGIAGPNIGQAFVDSRYPDGFRVFLNRESGNNRDMVSQVVWIADGLAPIFEFGLSTVPKYVLGGVCFSNETCRNGIHRFFDRVGITNVKVHYVESKPSTQHHTPLRPSLAVPLVFDGYVRTEFSTAFRNDLQHTGNLPWRRQE